MVGKYEMVTTHTKESLIAFEERVKQAFLDKRIRAPVHLSGGNEEQLIDIFKKVQPGDWVFSTWRSHYHALLKGIPEEWIFNEILEGRSMYLMSNEHHFFCSAIVGGILPIACGVAMGIRRHTDELKVEERTAGYYGDWPWGSVEGDVPTVWVFIGDMTSRTGIFNEFAQYCSGHELPVKVVIEDNGLSTNTPTQKVWGEAEKWIWINRHKYTRTYPHTGVGQHVTF